MADRVRPERADHRQQQGIRHPRRHGQRNLRAIRAVALPAPSPVPALSRSQIAWLGTYLKREGNAFRFAAHTFRVFSCRPLPDEKIKDSTNFARDARGHWFLNIVFEMPDVPARPIRPGVGIDLGPKDVATLSTGETLPHVWFGQRATAKLAKAQRT